MFLQQLLDPPDETGIVAALQHLRSLGAFDEKNALTPLGSHLASMPVDAQIGKLLVYGALLRCPEQILTIAAGLSGKSPFLRDAVADQTKQRLSGRYMSDHLALLGAVQAWQQKRRESGASAARSLCVEMGLHSEGLKQLWETRAQVRSSTSV
jgi:HrpA-like RNA helicase